MEYYIITEESDTRQSGQSESNSENIQEDTKPGQRKPSASFVGTALTQAGALVGSLTTYTDKLSSALSQTKKTRVLSPSLPPYITHSVCTSHTTTFTYYS